jgi:serine/threonine protein kinase
MTELVGQQLGHYHLLHLQGRGGFADVYLGEHVHLKSLAAIKILHSRISSDLQDSFLHEARILARLTHPHIIRILDFGIENSVPFLVMDFAPHGTIRQRYPHGTRLPLATVIPFIRQVADGLQYAHDQKLIHRDLKPENLLIGQRDELLLSDFGIALIAQTSIASLDDQQHRFAGTAAYMAPEQFQGRPCYASDQYSLAVLVYEWLCGRRPFIGTFIEIYSQHQSTTPPSVRSLVPDLPLEVEQVLMTALAKEPERRFASVKAFSNALEQASGLISMPSNQPSAFVSAVQTPPPPSNPVTPTPGVVASSYPSLGPLVPLAVDPAIAQEDARSAGNVAPAFVAETASSQASSMRAGQYLHSLQTSPTQPKWFLQRKFLLIATFIVVVLLVGNALLFSFLHAFHASDITLQPTVSIPSSLSTPGTTEVATTQPTSVPTKVATTQPTSAPPVTPTPLPPTPTPDASSYSSSLNAQDSANWDVLDYNGGGGCAFSGGAYHATMPQKGAVAQCIAESSNVTNFSYQVQMKIMSGDGGGLIFRSDAHGDFYRLRIGTDGTYDLVSQRSSIVSSSSSAIIQGVNQVNVIKIVATGSQISLYANGHLLNTVKDTASSSGRIGVFAVDFSQPTDVAFSNIEAQAL